MKILMRISSKCSARDCLSKYFFAWRVLEGKVIVAYILNTWKTNVSSDYNFCMNTEKETIENLFLRIKLQIGYETIMV